MYLIVGLGNPGKKYQHNRHNVGFMAVDSIVRRYNFEQGSCQYNSDTYKGTIEDTKVLVVKPLTFMNESGKSVSAFVNFFKIDLKKVIIIHDELDLVLGKVKLNIGGGTAGHNGLKSINTMVSNNYLKLRIGIGHPEHKDLVAKYVLEDFKRDEMVIANEVLEQISILITHVLKGNLDLFSSEINQYNRG